MKSAKSSNLPSHPVRRLELRTDDPRAIPDALTRFDFLPDSAHVRQPVVEALFCCSPSTIWRLVKRGKLKPHKLSEGVTGFNVGELRQALQAR